MGVRMASAQLNVRIDTALKSRGDEALSKMGIGATEAVRMLWEYAAQHQRLPVELFPEGDGSEEASAARLVRLAEDGVGLAVRGTSAAGMGAPSVSYDNSSWRDVMYDNRAEEFERLMGKDETHGTH